MTGNADSIASLFIHCAPKFITPAPDLEDLRSGKVVSAPYGGIQVSSDMLLSLGCFQADKAGECRGQAGEAGRE